MHNTQVIPWTQCKRQAEILGGGSLKLIGRGASDVDLTNMTVHEHMILSSISFEWCGAGGAGQDAQPSARNAGCRECGRKTFSQFRRT